MIDNENMTDEKDVTNGKDMTDDNNSEQYSQADNRLYISLFIATVLTYLAVLISLPIAELIQKGVSSDHLKAALSFMFNSLIDPMMVLNKIASLFKFVINGENMPLAYYLPICAFLFFPITLVVSVVKNSKK